MELAQRVEVRERAAYLQLVEGGRLLVPLRNRRKAIAYPLLIPVLLLGILGPFVIRCRTIGAEPCPDIHLGRCDPSQCGIVLDSGSAAALGGTAGIAAESNGDSCDSPNSCCDGESIFQIITAGAGTRTDEFSSPPCIGFTSDTALFWIGTPLSPLVHASSSTVTIARQIETIVLRV
jgi:hypothetical protein